MQRLFDDANEWSRFCGEAESWVGTPYRHMQRAKGRGADCALFIAGVLLETGYLRDLDYQYYPRDWHLHTQEEYVLDGIYRHVAGHMSPGLAFVSLPLDTPLEVGDWVAFATTERRVTNHCGLVWPDGQMLHAINGRGVSYTPLGGWWRRRLRFVGRFMREEGPQWA